MSRSRAEQRQGIDVPNRLRLIEGDLDASDERMTGFSEELAKVRVVLQQILVALVVASMMLAANLVLGR